MIFGVDFNDGDILWFCEISFSKKNKVYSRTFPMPVIVREIKHGYGTSILVDESYFKVESIKGNYIESLRKNMNWGDRLFKTEEDCREYWRSRFLDKIDECKSYYEKQLEYLTKYMGRKK